MRGLASTLPRPESLSAGLTTSQTETDTHVIIAGTAGDRTTTTSDTASCIVGESLLTTCVVRAPVGGEGTGATVSVGRHDCSFLFVG